MPALVVPNEDAVPKTYGGPGEPFLLRQVLAHDLKGMPRLPAPSSPIRPDLRLCQLESGVDRLSRYKHLLCRQAHQTVFTLELLQRPKNGHVAQAFRSRFAGAIDGTMLKLHGHALAHINSH